MKSFKSTPRFATINYIKIVFNKKVCLEIDVYTNVTEIRACARIDNQKI